VNRPDAAEEALSVSVAVDEPAHLGRVQTTTRGFCRSIGLDESAVFEAVIAVTELAHRRFVERSRRGLVELSAVRLGRRVGLEARADDAVISIIPSGNP
jgi:hypothetical protein